MRRRTWRAAAGAAAVVALVAASLSCAPKARPSTVPRPSRGQEGYASWYGPKFHGRTTASGEPYNMLGLTAAHRSLPFGTYVRVTRVESGRRLVVRVNDRGPFVRGRIIDLSYAAAKVLDLTGVGVARVRVEVIDPEEGARLHGRQSEHLHRTGLRTWTEDDFVRVERTH